MPASSSLSSSSSSSKSLEAKTISNFIDNKENTMKANSSVGMAVYALVNHYFKDKNSTQIDKYCTDAIQELTDLAKNTTDTELRKAIDNIILKTTEPVNALDDFTVYLPVSEGTKEFVVREATYTVPLKQIMTLVWLALKDDASFENDSNMKMEKSRLLRKETFFRSLKDIEKENPCHMGIRNYCVFSLNHAHVDVNFIEDRDNTLIEVVRTELNILFWKQYPTTESGRKREMQTALFDWMQSGSPILLLNLLDPEKTILLSFKKLLLKNGIHPEEAEKLYYQKMEYIDFACDLKAHPELGSLRIILSQSSPKHSSPANAALRRMQQWIKGELELGNPKHEMLVRDFEELYSAQECLKKENELLMLTSHLDHFTNDSLTSLQSICTRYFKTLSEVKNIETCTVTAEDKKPCQVLRQTIEADKKDTLKTVIENFFADWDRNEIESDTRKNLYSMLIRESYRQKIILKDEYITQLISDAVKESKETKDNTFPITPYLINRVLLHAIIIDPVSSDESKPVWSDTFLNEALLPVLDFIKNKLNDEGIEGALKITSYSTNLIQQIEYLVKLREISDKKKKLAESKDQHEELALPIRPDNLFLLPHQIKTPQEWGDIYIELSEVDRENIYTANAFYLDNILIENKLKEYSRSYNNSLNPDEMTIVHTECIPRISLYDYDVDALLKYIPPSYRKKHLIRLLNEETLEVKSPLKNIIKHIPETDHKEFLKYLSTKKQIFSEQECIRSINLILGGIDKKPIPEEEALAFFLAIPDEPGQPAGIRTMFHFVVDPIEQIKLLEYCGLKAESLDLTDPFGFLVCALQEMKDEHRLPALTQTLSKWLDIKTDIYSSRLKEVVSLIPEENRLESITTLLPFILKGLEENSVENDISFSWGHRFWAELLDCLNEKEQIAYIRMLPEKIIRLSDNNFVKFDIILPKLKKAVCLEFLNILTKEHVIRCIITPRNLIEFIKYLSSIECLHWLGKDFVFSLIKKSSELDDLIVIIPENERLKVLKWFGKEFIYQKITSQLELQNMLLRLPESDKSFLTEDILFHSVKESKETSINSSLEEEDEAVYTLKLSNGKKAIYYDKGYGVLEIFDTNGKRVNYVSENFSNDLPLSMIELPNGYIALSFRPSMHETLYIVDPDRSARFSVIYKTSFLGSNSFLALTPDNKLAIGGRTRVSVYNLVSEHHFNWDLKIIKHINLVTPIESAADLANVIRELYTPLHFNPASETSVSSASLGLFSSSESSSSSSSSTPLPCAPSHSIIGSVR